jgi:hypothetical protein
MNTPVNHLWNILYPMLPRFLSADDSLKAYSALHESQRIHKEQVISLHYEYKEYVSQCDSEEVVKTFEQFYKEKFNH